MRFLWYRSLNWFPLFWSLLSIWRKLKRMRYTFLCVKSARHNTSLLRFYRKSILQRLLPKESSVSLILLFFLSMLWFLRRGRRPYQNILIRMIWKSLDLVKIFIRAVHLRHVIQASVPHDLRHFQTAHRSDTNDIHMSVWSDKSLFPLFWLHDHSLFAWIRAYSNDALLCVSKRSIVYPWSASVPMVVWNKVRIVNFYYVHE